MFDRGLAHAFKFTESDLNFNRQGQFSPEQLQQTEAMNRGCIRSSAGFTLLFVIAMAGAYLALDGEDRTGAVITLGIFAALGGGALLISWWTRNDSFDMHHIEGEGRLRTDRTDNGTRYVLNISGFEFTVDPAQYEILQDGAGYLVHYSVTQGQKNLKTASKQIRSIEPLA
jgi:hypothetical protein